MTTASPPVPPSRRVNGILTIAPGTLLSPTNAAAHNNRSSRQGKRIAADAGEKVIIRCLPPGLTESEFLAALPDEWKVGNGRVDWCSFTPGKVPQDLYKHARPSYAHLHLVSQEFVQPMHDFVRDAVWHDSMETYTSSAYSGHPILEIAFHKKVPLRQKHVDSRQGTIDQEPEFMAFLDDLANPDLPPPATDLANEEKKAHEQADNVESAPRGTALIDYIREKKAAKAKDAAATPAKSAKHSRQEPQASKGPGPASPPSEESKAKSKGGDKTPARSKGLVKLLVKDAAAAAADSAAHGVGPAPARLQNQEAPAKQSRRADISAAAKILQRDLGLNPGVAHRRARQEVAKAESEAAKSTTAKSDVLDGASASVVSKTPANAASATPKQAPTAPRGANQPSASSGRGRNRRRGGAANEDHVKGKAATTAATTGKGEENKPPAVKPVTLLTRDREITGAPAKSVPSASTDPSNTNPTLLNAPKAFTSGKAVESAKSPGKGGNATASLSSTPATARAFIKHANPSQGVTEPLLKEVLQVYGPVTFVEIDRRKGFAYVDFVDSASLAKAMLASPIAVAQASVQVLERREPKISGTAGPPATSAQASPTKNSGGKAPSLGPSSRATQPHSKRNAALTEASTLTAASTRPASDKKPNRRRGGRGRGRGAGDAGESATDATLVPSVKATPTG